MNEIGLYIKKMRKQKGLTQQQLADKLNVSFQAVSKWENGETLPDVALLLDLCNELDTTADTLLNGGVVINKNRKTIRVKSIVQGFEHIAQLKDCFGEHSTFYQGIVQGISDRMNFDFEEALTANPQVLYAEAVIQYLLSGYRVDIAEARQWITNEKYLNEIKKRMN